MRILLTLLAIAVFVGCKTASTEPNISYDFRGSKWLLSEYYESDGSEHTIDTTRMFWFYLSKSGDTINGMSGCNRFSGIYYLTNNHFRDTCITTAVYCLLTAEFYDALSDATVTKADSVG